MLVEIMPETIAKIIEKAHCPRCGDSVMTPSGIYLQLISPDGDNRTAYLHPALGNPEIKLGTYDAEIPIGTDLHVKCRYCQIPVHKKHHQTICFVNRVKLFGDPYEDYEVMFLPKKGKYGTVLIKENVIIGKWGKDADELISALAA